MGSVSSLISRHRSPLFDISDLRVFSAMSRGEGTRSEIKDDDTCYAGQGRGLIPPKVSARDDATEFFSLWWELLIIFGIVKSQPFNRKDFWGGLLLRVLGFR